MKESETGRVEAFSDGVFAVAITLLVLDLKAPAVAAITPKMDLFSLLLHQWPSFLAFGLSFITILFIWLNHHLVVKLIKINDGKMMLINGLLLLVVTVIPFSTALLAAHLGRAGSNEAIKFYNGTLFLVALIFQAFWRYAIKDRRLLGPDCDHREVKRITLQFNIGFALYAAAFLTAFLFSAISLAINIFLVLYFTGVGILKRSGTPTAN